MAVTDTPSLARSFYQRFLASADRIAFLEGLVNSSPPTFETEWLEFKMYPQEDNDQKNEQKIKEFWCINLSAFGNTQGGVLIWGIGAKQIDKVDAAWSRPLVPSPDALRTKLFELHHLATDPPLSGVEIEAVTVPNAGGKGFVVCFIPQGAFVPYRAEFNIKNYYIRIGDDSIIPSPVILRRLFYPQSLARVELSVTLTKYPKTMMNSTVDETSYVLSLQNSGYSTANDVYVIVKDNVPYNNPQARGVIQSNNHWNMRYSTPNESGLYALVPIHPRFSTDVAYSHTWTKPRQMAGHAAISWDTTKIIGEVFCRGTERQLFEIEFAEVDFHQTDRCTNKYNMM